MGDSALKSVIVILDTPEVEDSDDNFEIDFCSENRKVSDLAVIKEKLVAKSERAKILSKDRDSVFKRESKYKQGIWVVVGDDSPVKFNHKCSFKTKKTLSFSADVSSGMYYRLILLIRERPNILSNTVVFRDRCDAF